MTDKRPRAIAALEVEVEMTEAHVKRLSTVGPKLADPEQQHNMAALVKEEKDSPHATASEEMPAAGSRAMMTVPLPLPPDLISKLPPSCRSRSRIPLTPTPDVPAESMAYRFSGDMPFPLSSTSTRIWLS